MTESNSSNAALCSSISSPELNGASGPTPRKDGEVLQDPDGTQTGNAASESSSDTGVSTQLFNSLYNAGNAVLYSPSRVLN